MKKKLLVMASTFPRWKNDTNPPFVYELSRRLVKDFDVTVLAPSFPSSKKFEVMNEMKVYRFRYFISKFEKLAGSGGILPTLKKNKLYYFTVPFFFLGEYLAARKLVKEKKFDVIHAHWIIPQGVVAYWLNKKFKIPYVVTTHGGDIFGLQGKILTKIKKKVLKNAKKITVVSSAIKKEINEKISKRLYVEIIPMGVDSKLFNPDKYDESLKEKYRINGPFLLFVGRLAEKKGVKYLIEAMPEIIKNNTKTKLMIIGSGPLEKELKELSKKLKVDKNIIFMGAIQNNELPKYYATADIFIGPSIEAMGGDKEGFGLTFVEAGMSGCQIIATDLNAMEDIIKNNKTGFIVKQKNSKEISEKINQLNGKRLNAREKLIKKFDWRNTSEGYKKIL
ncbi:glycosyltransferase [archaeon]|nr:glycosyltransferase [archaeon]